jgi:predicted nucleic acid-binding protein
VTFIAPVPPIVMDASFAVDGVTGDAAATAAWSRWADEGRMILAPAIVWPEVANALKSHHVAAGEIAAHLEVLEAAGLETADRGARGVAHALGLAEHHRLSVYDATYLWLAIDIDGELATTDRALASAAEAEGVPLAFEP